MECQNKQGGDGAPTTTKGVVFWVQCESDEKRTLVMTRVSVTYILFMSLVCGVQSLQSLSSSYRSMHPKHITSRTSILSGWNDKVEVSSMDGLFDRKEKSSRGRPRLSAEEKAHRAAKRVEDKEIAQWVMDEMMKNAVADVMKNTPLAKEIVWIEVPYEQMLDYFKTYGNLHIPYDYEVAGYPLGEKVREMRKLYQKKDHEVEPMYKDELQYLCFEWKHSRAQYNMRRHQLTLYKKLHGHLLVPKEFVIPSDTIWPKPYHGVLLGQVVANMRNRLSFYEHREELTAMGFVWDQVDVVLQALEEYKRRYGHVRIKKRFVIPLEEEVPERSSEENEIEDAQMPWPAVMQGMKLGELVSRIRLKNAFANHREKFIELGIDYKVSARA